MPHERGYIAAEMRSPTVGYAANANARRLKQLTGRGTRPLQLTAIRAPSVPTAGLRQRHAELRISFKPLNLVNSNLNQLTEKILGYFRLGMQIV